MGNAFSSVLPFAADPSSPAFVNSLNLAVQLVGFSIAAPLKTEKFYDAFGALGFLSTVGYSFFSNDPTHQSTRAILATTTTILWTLRLGSFLIRRVLNSKNGDSRFDDIKGNPLKFLGAWVAQAVWVGVTAAPVVLVNCANGGRFRRHVAFGASDALGLGIWALGFGLEIVADRQKSDFNARIEKAGKEKTWIQEGLWRYSRHPNYFGECLLWLGQLVLCSGGLRHLTLSEWALAISSPIFVTLLITQLSGIPLLEKSADKKWGHVAAYQSYKRRTSVFVPWSVSGEK